MHDTTTTMHATNHQHRHTDIREAAVTHTSDRILAALHRCSSTAQRTTHNATQHTGRLPSSRPYPLPHSTHLSSHSTSTQKALVAAAAVDKASIQVRETITPTTTQPPVAAPYIPPCLSIVDLRLSRVTRWLLALTIVSCMSICAVHSQSPLCLPSLRPRPTRPPPSSPLPFPPPSSPGTSLLSLFRHECTSATFACSL